MKSRSIKPLVLLISVLLAVFSAARRNEVAGEGWGPSGPHKPGAGNEIRTRDPLVGNEMLYH